MKYSVIIPTYNHCDDLLKPCIESIFKYTNLADIELIISANGCSDNTSLYLDELRYKFNSLGLAKNFQVSWSDKALGYPKAINDGIKLSTTDKIVLLNNDCILLEQKQNDWLNILNTSFEQNEKCGVSCVVKEHSKVMNYDFAIFFCVMIDRKCFNDIGYLNEEYTPGSGEDMEFCILAQQKGYEICQVYDIMPLDKKYFTGNFPIYHLGEGTVHDKKLVPEWSSIFLRNKFKLAKKYNEEWKKVKKQNDKKIAVITPVYNDIERIFFTIDCVKKQTIDNVIHYIYDDASTDGFFEGIQEFVKQDNTVRVFCGDENKGQSFGRNILIKKAIADGCDYIAFLDSDDFWHEHHLEKNISHLNKYDVVYSKPTFVGNEGTILKEVNIPVPNIFVGKQLLHNNYIWISSVVAKKECFVNNEFDSSLNSIEDWDMWIRLYQQQFTFLNKQENTVRYLVKENNQASIGQTKYPLLKQKHELLDKLKLHLACGHDYNEDYINVDLYAPEDAVCDLRFDVQKLPYPDNSVDEIKAFHIIEHFHFFEIKDTLNEWYRVLKPGGRLYLETPDFLETCRSFVEGSPTMPIEDWRVLLYGHFFAHPWVPGQTHKFLFTETQLRTNLSWAGFKTVNRLPPASKYVMDHTKHLFLTVEAFK
jgi:teichuronic acid biosynthesis glycosyltransferase TuaG